MKTVLLTLLATAGTCHAQNLLANGDLELPGGGGPDDIDAWTLTEPDLDAFLNPVNSAEFQGFANHTPAGARGLWLRSFAGNFDDNSPDTVNAILTQAVAGNAGQMYSLSAWFLYEEHYSGLDPTVGTETFLAIDFLDAGLGVIGTVAIDIDQLQTGDSTWRQYFVNGVAPGGTAFVQARAEMRNGIVDPENPQSAFVDDFVLVPAPGGAIVLGLVGLTGVRRRR